MSEPELYRSFSLSCPVFAGYTRWIDVGSCATIQDIIDSVLGDLAEDLSRMNFELLAEKLASFRAEYHIHDHTLEDIRKTETEYYVCRVCPWS